MTKKEKFLIQIDLQNKAIEAGVNIVTCGDCGDVLLVSADAEEVECPHCGFKADQCDFPDLFYTGMEVHESFQFSDLGDDAKRKAIDYCRGWQSGDGHDESHVEYLKSDEAVIAMIQDNGFEFDERGNLQA